MKHFRIEEFECKCGCGSRAMKRNTLAKLDLARALAGVPFVVSSGYRCEAHNRAVGGKSSSAHTRGFAVDIRTPTSAFRFKILNALLKSGFTRIGIAKTFIHADNDPSLPQEVMWDY